MRLNLMSNNDFDSQGFKGHFANGMWKLTKGSLVVSRGKAFCLLYKTHGQIIKEELNTVEDSSPNLWHSG